MASHPDLAGQSLRRLSWALEERGVELVVSPGIVEVAGPRLSIRPVAGLSLLHLERPTFGGRRLLVKTVFDRVAAALLLLVLLAAHRRHRARRPARPAAGRRSSARSGSACDGRPFTMLKFRSMVRRRRAAPAGAAPSSTTATACCSRCSEDPRVTRVGALLRRFSLDELPQLFNVLRGRHVAGRPAPAAARGGRAYDDDAARRLRVRPGMTGLWQVSGRSDLSWEESLRLDLRYVDNWSLALDLSILWRTWRAVIRGSGAY